MSRRLIGLRWLAIAASAVLHGSVLAAGYMLMDVGAPPASDGVSVEIIADLGAIKGPKTAPVEPDESDTAKGRTGPRNETRRAEPSAARPEPANDVPPILSPDKAPAPVTAAATASVDPVPIDPSVDMVLPVAPPRPPKARPAKLVAEERAPAEAKAKDAPIEAAAAANEGTARETSRAITPAGAIAAGTAAAAIAGNPLPAYPKRERRRGIEGLVLLKVTVSPEGFAESVRIENSSGHHSLDQAARETVVTWRFHPARRLGQPVKSNLLVPIRFRLER